jgi:putative intracellular protease/amidase
VYDHFADLEVSHLLSCIIKSNRYHVKTIAIDKAVKQSLSGLSIVPDFDFLPQVDLKDIDEDNTALLILPGGKGWIEKMNFEIEPLVKHCYQRGITLAASGEATLLLADMKLLDKTRHISINASYLNTFSSACVSADHYVNHPSVYHQGIITANGLDPVDFSNTVLKVLELNAHVDQSVFEEIIVE